MTTVTTFFRVFGDHTKDHGSIKANTERVYGVFTYVSSTPVFGEGAGISPWKVTSSLCAG